VVEDGEDERKSTSNLRADEEMKSILAAAGLSFEKDGHLRKGLVLARVQGDLANGAEQGSSVR